MRLWWCLVLVACGGSPEGKRGGHEGAKADKADKVEVKATPPAPVTPPAPATPPAPVEPPPAAPAAAPAPDRARGMVRLGKGDPAFTGCDGATVPRLMDPQNLLRETAKLLGAPAAPFYAEVVLGPEGPGGARAVSRVELALVTGLGCEAKPGAWLVRASGNEPGWVVTLSKEGTTVLRQEGGELKLPAATEVPRKGGSVWTAKDGAHTLTLELTDAPCADTMAEARYPYTAVAKVDGAELRGCARGAVP